MATEGTSTTTAPTHRAYYHRDHGVTYLHTIDGDDAVARHPHEWSDKPWPSAGADKPADGKRKEADR